VELVFNYFFNELPRTDINYGSVRSLLLSATPLTSSPLENIPIISLLTGEELLYQQLFKQFNGED
jgi:hypothetical protein